MLRVNLAPQRAASELSSKVVRASRHMFIRGVLSRDSGELRYERTLKVRVLCGRESIIIGCRVIREIGLCSECGFKLLNGYEARYFLRDRVYISTSSDFTFSHKFTLRS